MEELWDELRRLGVGEEKMPTPRALEDWQAEGLVATERRGLGRGRGSRSVYRPGSAEKVVDLIGYLKDDRSFARARIVLFYRGHDIDEAASYLAAFDELLAALGVHSDEDFASVIITRKDQATARRRLRKAYRGAIEGTIRRF